MWYPTGSCKPPFPGGGIALASSFALCSSLPLEARAFVLDRWAISVLASVVSEGSPGSSFWMLGITEPLALALSPAAEERVRGRFGGGLFTSKVLDFLCLELLV